MINHESIPEERKYIVKNPYAHEVKENLKRLLDYAKKHYENTGRHLAAFIYYSGHGVLNVYKDSVQRTTMILRGGDEYEIQTFLEKLAM